MTISIAKDFTTTPGARYKTDGPFSGELFREKLLEPLFKDQTASEEIVVDLDGTAGYATSFLEESFGGLARKFGKTRIRQRLKFKSEDDPSLIIEIEKYISNVQEA